MLPKKKRLNLKKDFSWVASGRKSGNDLIKLFFRFGNNEEPRIGIALSKSTFKKATDRNRARRLISSGFEALFNKLPPKINIVAMPREEILKADSEKVKEVLEDLLEKEKTLIDENSVN